jgi:signal transduction histidine kinase/ActR/RegA family two-component response regulator
MKRRFRDRSIREKLTLITLASSASALLFASAGFFIWDFVQYRLQVGRDLTVLARTLADNSTAPLAFADERAAGETLAVLELQPYVETACIYNGDGRPFAMYANGTEGECPALPADVASVGWSVARLVGPIALDGRRIGTLLIERDLADLRGRVAIAGGTVAALLVLATLMALMIGARMQRAIATPLLALADTARSVSASSQYSLRAPETSHDEVGVVVRAFNDMLDRIEERTRELVQANRLKDEFLATLSHELRTPLNAVLGWTRILRSTSVSPDTQARALESIERNARQQTALIEDLLEVSRIVSGKMRLDVRPCDLAAIVDAAVDVVQPAAAAKDIRLTIDLQRPAPTIGDPDRLQQIVWNVLSNAVKFTAQGGRVEVRLTRDTGYQIVVSDSGIGIQADFLPHIFQRFRQGDASATREYGGLGLGLAIVRQLVELHGGTVGVQSDGPGKGATFTIHLPSELPVAAPAESAGETTRAVAARQTDSESLDGTKVLVVDDDADARDVLQTMFEARGMQVRAVPSAEAAIKALDAQLPDIIISDIGMPVEDGFSLMRRIRRRPVSAGGGVPAIALTAYAAERDRGEAMSAGYQEHVAKPFDPADLIARVAQLRRSR